MAAQWQGCDADGRDYRLTEHDDGTRTLTVRTPADPAWAALGVTLTRVAVADGVGR